MRNVNHHMIEQEDEEDDSALGESDDDETKKQSIHKNIITCLHTIRVHNLLLTHTINT